MRSLGLGKEGAERAGGREPRAVKADVIWRRARALSKGVIGMSPQSRMVRGLE